MADFIDFNPRESLKKNSIAVKVAMENVQPFTKRVETLERATFTGGSKFRNGDTIMARITPCLENGKTAFVDFLEDGEVAFGSTEFIVLRAKESISDPQYIYYLAMSPDVRNVAIKSMVGSSGRQRVQQSVLNEYVVPLPNIDQQRLIGRFLADLDDKIALNQKINRNLEEQSQTIFTSFMLSHQTSSITVGDLILTANTGADAIQKAPIVDYDTGVKCIRVGDMSNRRPVHEWGFTKVTPEVFAQYQLHKNDIVVTRTASLGLNRLIADDLQAVYNNGLIRLTVNKNIVLPLLVYRQFQTEDYRNYIGRITSETSVRPNMKINYLLKYSFEILNKPDQKKLADILEPFFLAQEKNVIENQRLCSLRDTLLPKLMSGEMDVSELDI